ncbi:MAG: hypothetical protein M4579_001513 [Chaenotheca gracillima]|nr:MAG: hypothetical protein M4579_001513 [Chaenotheca gracillima]
MGQLFSKSRQQTRPLRVKRVPTPYPSKSRQEMNAPPSLPSSTRGIPGSDDWSHDGDVSNLSHLSDNSLLVLEVKTDAKGNPTVTASLHARNKSALRNRIEASDGTILGYNPSWLGRNGRRSARYSSWRPNPLQSAESHIEVSRFCHHRKTGWYPMSPPTPTATVTNRLETPMPDASKCITGLDETDKAKLNSLPTQATVHPIDVGQNSAPARHVLGGHEGFLRRRANALLLTEEEAASISLACKAANERSRTSKLKQTHKSTDLRASYKGKENSLSVQARGHENMGRAENLRPEATSTPDLRTKQFSLSAKRFSVESAQAKDFTELNAILNSCEQRITNPRMPPRKSGANRSPSHSLSPSIPDFPPLERTRRSTNLPNGDKRFNGYAKHSPPGIWLPEGARYHQEPKLAHPIQASVLTDSDCSPLPVEGKIYSVVLPSAESSSTEPDAQTVIDSLVRKARTLQNNWDRLDADTRQFLDNAEESLGSFRLVKAEPYER